ncbi:MAG: hypothetical protein K5905_18355 [Roseibium sp.]|uniref:hypothetical protein n=1 Tax=Roseibium sp. TaxID=1936156 RepID=UPI002617541E|nr:hypothetical protein [Roseibium sp.]MCV0427427.1 hypothetical protein [Roseibium sp.]
MIHPQAAGNPFSAPLHRSFLFSCFLSGTVALFVLPLHLALAGAPHVATLLVLAWMLSQWPLALYLSQSGELDRAIGISSGLFAIFVAAICFSTGGSASFALFWLMIPPIEAAFASSRRIVVGITTLCAALLSAVWLLPANLVSAGPLTLEVKLIASLAALLYAGMIAYRISRDRSRAQNAVSVSETNRRTMCQSISEVLCQIDGDGQITVLGGPAGHLLGGSTPGKGEDWLFSRLHVGDRPLYLTRLSEVRNCGKPTTFSVRLRVGRNLPGDAGQAEYRVFELGLRTAPEIGPSQNANVDVLLVIRDRSGSGLVTPGEMSPEADPRVAKVSWTLVEAAGKAVKRSLTDIQKNASAFEPRQNATAAVLREKGEQIERSSRVGLNALAAILELAGEGDVEMEPGFSVEKIGSSLEQCCELLAPLAERADVSIDLEVGQDWGQLTADGKLLTQSMCFILSDMIETSGNGAVIRISGDVIQSKLQLVLSVKNRSSSLSWNSADSGPVLEFAGNLLEKAGARLSVQTALGHGESVIVDLQTRASDECDETPEAAENVLPLVQTA